MGFRQHLAGLSKYLAGFGQHRGIHSAPWDSFSTTVFTQHLAGFGQHLAGFGQHLSGFGQHRGSEKSLAGERVDPGQMEPVWRWGAPLTFVHFLTDPQVQRPGRHR